MDTEATRNLTRFNSVIEAYNPKMPLTGTRDFDIKLFYEFLFDKWPIN